MLREPSTVELPPLSESSTKGSLNSLSGLIPWLAPYKFPLCLAIFSVVLAGLSLLVMGHGLKSFIDDGFVTENFTNLHTATAVLIGCVIALAIASYGRSYYVSWVGERLMSDLRFKLFEHLVHLDIGFFENHRPGELSSHLMTDLSLIQILIGTSAAVALRNLLLFIGGFSMMLLVSPKLSAITLLIVPIVLIPILLLGKRVKGAARSSQQKIASLTAGIIETFSGIRNLQAFNREPYEICQFLNRSEQAFDTAVTHLKNRSFLSFIVMVLVFTGISIVLWLGGMEVIEGTLSAGELSAFLFYAIAAAAAAGSFSEIYADGQRAAGAFERIRELIQIQPSITSPWASKQLAVPSRGVIAFHNINFAYPNNPKQPILQNFTFSVAPGEKVAIVGPSGSGKSTTLSLLLRFFDSTSGSIYVDGQDIKEYNLVDLRRRFGIVPQDPAILSATLYENILYGKPEASETEVWHAAESAHLLEVIQNLPHGIHTHLGTNGVKLSGGQKQRLAIARVILRNAPILLLDEATSSLDAESERLVQDSLKRLMATRTTLVVAHRLATVLKADKIIVLNKGHIEAVGTHAELISEDGLYQRLATLQFTDSLDMTRRQQKGATILS
jgi:ATP-binding cassette, subfamily B, bacterial